MFLTGSTLPLLALSVTAADPAAALDESGLSSLPPAITAPITEAAAAALSQAVPHPDRPTFRWTRELDDRRERSSVPYPNAAGWEASGREPVPLTLLPTPATLAAAGSPAAGADGAELGYALYFDPGPRTEAPPLFPPPPGDVRSVAINLHSWEMKAVGRITGPAAGPDPGPGPAWFNPGPGGGGVLAPLKLGEPGGATALATVVTRRLFRDNPRLLDVTVDGPAAPEFDLSPAYAMVPGNGVWRLPWRRAAGAHAFDNPLSSPEHDPGFGPHSLLRLPQAGRAWPIGGPDAAKGDPPLAVAREVLAMDRWFAEQPQKLWVLRAAEDYRPFRPSYVLLPADRSSELPVHSLYLFDGWDAGRIAEELAKVTVPADQGEGVSSATGYGRWRPGGPEPPPYGALKAKPEPRPDGARPADGPPRRESPPTSPPPR